MFLLSWLWSSKTEYKRPRLNDFVIIDKADYSKVEENEAKVIPRKTRCLKNKNYNIIKINHFGQFMYIFTHRRA